MLEQLREKYLVQLNDIKNKDIDLIVEEEINKVKEQIKEKVMDDHNNEILMAELKVKAVDEMIADEMEQSEQLETEQQENLEV